MLDAVPRCLYIRNISGAKSDIIEPTSSNACPDAVANVMPRAGEGKCCGEDTVRIDSGFNNTLRSALGNTRGASSRRTFFYGIGEVDGKVWPK